MKKLGKNMACNCDTNILEDAKHVGRAHWVCPKCGADVSLYYVLLWEMREEEKKNQLSKKAGKKRSR